MSKESDLKEIVKAFKSNPSLEHAEKWLNYLKVNVSPFTSEGKDILIKTMNEIAQDHLEVGQMIHVSPEEGRKVYVDSRTWKYFGDDGLLRESLVKYIDGID